MGATTDNNPFGSSAEIGVGFPDAVLLAASLTGLAILATTVYSIVMVRLKSAKQLEEEGESYDQSLTHADVSTLNRAQRRARARAIMKQQRRAEVAPEPTATEEEADEVAGLVEDIEDIDDDDDTVNAGMTSHLGESRKERKKAAKMAEKEERRFMGAERQQQQKEVQETAQAQKREKLRQHTRKQESQRRLDLLTKLENEKLEQKAWTTFFSSSNEYQSVEDWIDEMKEKRSIKIEDIANKFDVSPNNVVARIKELIKQERAAGVLEGDGRFIYFSEEELQAIAETIKDAGSVSAADVASICNTEISIK
jgi:hypothetical protein